MSSRRFETANNNNNRHFQRISTISIRFVRCQVWQRLLELSHILQIRNIEKHEFLSCLGWLSVGHMLMCVAGCMGMYVCCQCTSVCVLEVYGCA